MSSVAAARLPSFDDLHAEIQALPEGMTGEILGPGELRTMSRPGGLHSFSSRRLSMALGGSDLIAGGRGWWIEIEREIRLSSDLLYVPDLAGWRVEDPPDFVDDNPITVVPDWVCEILSRGTQRGDRARKIPNYALAGVGHVWIVDPEERSLEVYAITEGRASLVAAVVEPVVLALPPFATPIDVGKLWKPRRSE